MGPLRMSSLKSEQLDLKPFAVLRSTALRTNPDEIVLTVPVQIALLVTVVVRLTIKLTIDDCHLRVQGNPLERR